MISNKPKMRGIDKEELLLCAAILLLCIGIYGTISGGWWDKSVWVRAKSRDNFSILIGFSFVLNFILIRLGTSWPSLLIVPTILLVSSVGFGPVITVIWFWTCATTIGATITCRWTGHIGSVFSLRNSVIGYSIIGFGISLIAHFPVCTPIFFFSFLNVIALSCFWRISKQRKFLLPSFSQTRGAKLDWYHSSVGAIVMCGIYLVIYVTIMPDVGHDALAFHLNVPVRMKEAGLWRFDVTEYVWAVMPFGADWLYVPPYFFAGEPGVRLQNSSFLIATALGSYQLLKDRLPSQIALICPAILLTLPISFLEVGSTFVEAPLAFYFTMALSEIVGNTSSDKIRKGGWFVLGVISGYACAIKLPAVLALPFLYAGALIRAHDGKFELPKLKSLLVCIGAFIIFSAPPYLVAWLKTGNPVFPLFNNIFKSPYFDTVNSYTNVLFVRKLDLLTLWDMSINSGAFGEFQGNGAIGIAFIVLVPLSILYAVILRKWGLLACTLAALGYIALCFHNQAYLRYVFPVLPWLLITGVLAMSEITLHKGGLIFFGLILCMVNIMRFPVSHWAFAQFDLRLFGSSEAQKDFFDRARPQAVAGDIISKMDSLSGRKVLILDATSNIDPTYNHFPQGTIAASWHSWPYYSASINDSRLIQSLARSGAEIIVYPKQRSYKFEHEADELSTPIFRVQDIQVAEVNSEKVSELFVYEHLKNGNFNSGSVEWVTNGATFAEGKFKTTVSTPIFQGVDVSLFDSMLLEMNVECEEGKMFRSQINWNSSPGHFLSTDIQVHSCKPDGVDIKRIINKPRGAKFAIVYGGSSGDHFATISRISLRTP